jgi:hypothetical protein
MMNSEELERAILATEKIAIASQFYAIAQEPIDEAESQKAFFGGIEWLFRKMLLKMDAGDSVELADFLDGIEAQLTEFKPEWEQ